jgi:hypothetical protein
LKTRSLIRRLGIVTYAKARETIDVAGNEPGPHFWRFAQVGVMPAAELSG